MGELWNFRRRAELSSSSASRISSSQTSLHGFVPVAFLNGFLESFNKLNSLVSAMNFVALRSNFLLLFTSFFAQFKIFRVVYFVIVNTPHGYFNGTCGDVINKLTVVADYNYGFGTVNKKSLPTIEWIQYQDGWSARRSSNTSGFLQSSFASSIRSRQPPLKVFGGTEIFSLKS